MRTPIMGCLWRVSDSLRDDLDPDSRAMVRGNKSNHENSIDQAGDIARRREKRAATG